MKKAYRHYLRFGVIGLLLFTLVLTLPVNAAAEGRNAWQVVSGKYIGNDSSYKTLSADEKVRVQKNVIPTDTENEFLVYLAVDALTEQIATSTTITEVLEHIDTRALYVGGSGNGYPTPFLSTDEENNKPTSGAGGGALAPGVQGGEKTIAESGSDPIRLNIYNREGVLIASPLLRLTVPNSVLYLKVGDRYICLQNFKVQGGVFYNNDTGKPLETNKQGEYIVDVLLTDMSYNALFNTIVNEQTVKTSVITVDDGENPVTIQDKMGSYIFLTVFTALQTTSKPLFQVQPQQRGNKWFGLFCQRQIQILHHRSGKTPWLKRSRMVVAGRPR